MDGSPNFWIRCSQRFNFAPDPVPLLSGRSIRNISRGYEIYILLQVVATLILCPEHDARLVPLIRNRDECALFLRDLNFFRNSAGAAFKWKKVRWGELLQKLQVELSQFSSRGKDLHLWSRMNGVYNSAQLPNTASDANDGIR